MSFTNYRSDRGRGGDKRSFDKPQMHDAVCAKCGKACKVPFRPTGNKPIYCNDCFRAENNYSSDRADDRSSRSYSDRKLYDTVCDNCGNRCQIPFQPRQGRKVFCSHCFELMEKGAQTKPENNRVQEQLDAINIKLGKILQLLSTKTAIEESNKTLQNDTSSITEALEQVSKKDKKTVKKSPAKKKTYSKKKTTKKSA